MPKMKAGLYNIIDLKGRKFKKIFISTQKGRREMEKEGGLLDFL